MRVFCIVFLLVLLFPKSLYAADWSVKFGPGIEGQNLTGATKAFGFRREDRHFYGIYDAIELGGYSDSTPGCKAAGVAKLQIGAKPGPVTGLFGYAFFGPAFISATDRQLSTNLQFATDLGFGIRDQETFMSVGYGHISNAGVKLPNKGRDYVLFSVGISL